jgi:CRP-like cAMP-binding protein
VTATSAIRCLAIAPQQFRDVLGQNADIAVRILDAVTQRLRATLPATTGQTID